MEQKTDVGAAAAEPAPRVSIGLPVYNGDRFLEAAVHSVLAQTYDDFELIVSDNASTDRTPEILARFASVDPRVRVSRNQTNLGAGPNYDRCFHLARGEYFKWFAHDDLLDPTFLEKTVAALDATPDAILCAVSILEIDPDDREIRRYKPDVPGVESPDQLTRFLGAAMAFNPCVDYFSLIRREALVGTGLHGNYGGSDRVLIAELALRGRWVRIDEPLFINRDFPERFSRTVLAQRTHMNHWLDTRKPNRPHPYHWIYWRKYFELVDKWMVHPGDARAAKRALTRDWTALPHNRRGLIEDVQAIIRHYVPEPIVALKHRLFDPPQQRVSAQRSDKTPTASP